jgi:hypothetical protein
MYYNKELEYCAKSLEFKRNGVEKKGFSNCVDGYDKCYGYKKGEIHECFYDGSLIDEEILGVEKVYFHLFHEEKIFQLLVGFCCFGVLIALIGFYLFFKSFFLKKQKMKID